MLDRYPHIDPKMAREFVQLYSLIRDMLEGDKRVLWLLAGDDYLAFSSERPSICIALEEGELLFTLENCGTYELLYERGDEVRFFDWISVEDVPKVLMGEIRSH